MRKVKGFIFDLGGVIADTDSYNYKAWNKLSESKGLEFNDEVYKKIRGVSRLGSLEIILEHNNKEIDEITKKKWAEEKNELYVEYLENVTSQDYLPGAKEFLVDLKVRGYKLGLVSGSKNAKRVLENLNAISMFNVVCDGQSVANRKPAPDIFLYAIQKLNLEPEECVVLEDAFSGVNATNTGLTTIGIGEEDRIGYATYRYDHLKDINIDELLDKIEE